MLKSLVKYSTRLSKIFPIIILIFSLSACTKKLNFPIKLEVKAKEGFKEIIRGEFKSVSKAFKNDEIDRETHTKLLFELSSEVLNVKPDGKIVLIQKMLKKDGMFDLNRLGLPEVDENLKVEIDKRGFILDVSGYPQDSIFYIPSLVFPEKLVSPGESWNETFTWRDYSIPFRLQTDVKFTLKKQERLKGKQVLRIEIFASTKFLEVSNEIIYKSSSKGYVLWDPINYLVRYAESHFSDELQVPKKGFKSLSESDFILKLKSSS